MSLRHRAVAHVSQVIGFHIVLESVGLKSGDFVFQMHDGRTALDQK
jgi:hypothetical protein